MSAATEPAQHGKSTQGSALSVGDATRTLTLPHLPYADAVLAALDAAGLQPAAVEAGLRRGRTGTPELYARAGCGAGRRRPPARVRRARLQPGS